MDCYVRTGAISGPVDATLTALRELVDDGRIDGLTLHLWPPTVVLTDDTTHTGVVETYHTFKQWAERRGVRIEPSFTVESRTSRITGEQREVLVTPVCCLSISVEGSLRSVAPHHSEATTYTVDNALDTLSRGEEPSMAVEGPG